MSTTTPTDFAAQQAADRLARLERGVLLERPAGWAVMVTVRRSDSGPGLRGGDLEIDEVGDPWLVDAADWAAAHPGIEPTDAAMAKALDAADSSGWLLDEAADAVALEGN